MSRGVYAFFRSLVRTSPFEAAVVPSEVGAFLGYGDSLPAPEASLIETFIPVAQQYVEGVISQPLIHQEWRLETDGIPTTERAGAWWDGVVEGPKSIIYETAQAIELPRYPLVSVEAVELIDTTDTALTVDPAIYNVDKNRHPGRIALKYGRSWPTVTDRTVASFAVDFTAGHAETAVDVPASLKFAVVAIAAYMYDHRGCDAAGAARKSGALDALNPYRLRGLG